MIMCVSTTLSNTTSSTTYVTDHKEANRCYPQQKDKQQQKYARHHSRRRHHRQNHLEQHAYHQNPDYCQKVYLIMQLNLSYFACEKTMWMLVQNCKPGPGSYPVTTTNFNSSNTNDMINKRPSGCKNDNAEKPLNKVALLVFLSSVAPLLHSLNKLTVVATDADVADENASSSNNLFSSCSSQNDDHALRYHCNCDDKMTSLC